MSRIREALRSSAVRGSRTTMLLVILTTVLFVVTLSLGSKAALSYRTAQNIRQQSQDMQNTIKEWKQQSEIINHEKYRPVKPEQVDTVNSDILFKMQGNKLSITDYKAVARSSKNAAGHTFELTFKGEYADAVRFLSDFHSRDALINLISMKISPQDGKVRGTIRYRIYTK